MRRVISYNDLFAGFGSHQYQYWCEAICSRIRFACQVKGDRDVSCLKVPIDFGDVTIGGLPVLLLGR